MLSAFSCKTLGKISCRLPTLPLLKFHSLTVPSLAPVRSLLSDASKLMQLILEVPCAFPNLHHIVAFYMAIRNISLRAEVGVRQVGNIAPKAVGRFSPSMCKRCCQCRRSA